jgi:hypothetical protein
MDTKEFAAEIIAISKRIPADNLTDKEVVVLHYIYTMYQRDKTFRLFLGVSTDMFAMAIVSGKIKELLASLLPIEKLLSSSMEDIR